MAIVRWDPIKDLMAMQDMMSKAYDDAFNNAPNSSYGEFVPAVDIYETETQIVLMCELAGINEDDIDIQVSDGVLSIKGEKKYPLDKDSDSYFRLERSYGKFARSFSIPNTVDVNSVKANLKDGLLKITLQKNTQVKAKVIKVETD